MSNNPYESPDTTGKPSSSAWTRWPLRLFALFVVLGLLIALLLPAVRTARPAARRMQCANNLKQIALALRNYESAYQALPPAYTVDAEGKPLHSWRTLILPYMEQQPLYDMIDLSKPWDDPANREAYETSIPIYECPSFHGPSNHTTYLAVVAAGGCFLPGQPRKLSEITDQLDLTLMVVEVGPERHVHWMAPRDADLQEILRLGKPGQQTHPGTNQAACVDGNVLNLRTGMKAESLRALISIAGDDDTIAQEEL